MIYKLIILIASIFMIYEFTKSRSSVVAQFEPKISKYIQANKSIIYDQGDIRTIQTVANNQESFKRLIEIGYNKPAPYAIFDNNNVLNPYYSSIISHNDDPYFQWENMVLA